MKNILRLTSCCLRLAIRFYQLFLSPWLPRCCRYSPSCSHYALEVIKNHGAGRGLYLTIKRLASCQPWGGYGYHPAPPKNHNINPSAKI